MGHDDFFDFDSDTGGSSDSPSNGGSSDSPSNGGSSDSPSNGGSSDSPSNGESSRRNNGGGHEATNHKAREASASEELTSDESDQSEDTVMSGEEDSADGENLEDDFSNFLGFCAAHTLLQLLQEISVRRLTDSPAGSAPAESVSAPVTEAPSPRNPTDTQKDFKRDAVGAPDEEHHEMKGGLKLNQIAMLHAKKAGAI